MALNTIVAEVCDRLQARAAAKGIDLVFDGTPDDLEILADPADIDRMLTNLVGNAVKYTPKGSVRVTLSRESDRAKFVVADTGIGIPDESLPKLFQEFHRAKNAKALEEAGTGLGLAIVKDLVERYGGHDRRREQGRAGDDVHGHAAAGAGPAAAARVTLNVSARST